MNIPTTLHQFLTSMEFATKVVATSKLLEQCKLFTFGTSYTHHRLEANLACEVTMQR